MKKLKGTILSQNHRHSRGGVAQGAGAPSIEMPPMTKIHQKALFHHFQFVLASFAYNSTCVQQ